MRKRYPHYKPSGVDWLGEVPWRSQVSEHDMAPHDAS